MAKRAGGCAALLVLVLPLLLAFSASAQTITTTSSLLVKFVPGLSLEQQANVIARNGGVEGSSIPALRLHVVAVATEQLATVLANYQGDPQVQSVEINQTRQSETLPSDPFYSSQWALPKIGWDQVFGAITPAGSARVALLDTGVDASHPELAGKVLPGTSFLDGSDGRIDPSGHGTSLAGIIAANTDTTPMEGIGGVAYTGVQILPVTVLNANGEGQDSDVIQGVLWAADHGADVILMAFSAPDFSQNLQDAIDYAWSRGVVVVAAVGNNAVDTPTFPAGDRGVMGVAATDQNDAQAYFSNQGQAVFIAAPGVDIQTIDVNSGYIVINGTSAAAAHVAGLAALMKAVDSTLTNDVIVGRIARTADPAGTAEQTGNGRINMPRALADTSMEPVQPAGADPVGQGGPFVGPYRAAGNGTVTGTVTSSSGGGPIIGATVTCTSGCNGTPSTTSSAGGSYSLPITFPGGGPATVTVQATHPDFSTGSLNQSVPNDRNQPATANFSLTPKRSTSTAWSPASAAVTVGDSTGFTITVSDTGSEPKSAPTGTVTFSSSAAGVTFNPTPTCTLTSASGNGSMCSVTVTGSSATNSPYTLTAQYGSDTTHARSSGTATLTVNAQAPTTISAVSGSGTFGGTATLTATLTSSGSPVSGKTISFQLNGIPAGAGTTNASGVATVSGVSLTGINAGSYANAVSASFGGDSGFQSSSGSGTLTVAKATSTTTVTCPTSVTYTAAAQTPCAATVTGAGGLTQSLTVSYSDNTDAGTATAGASFAGDLNHDPSTDSKTFTIDKASSTTTVTCPASVTYDGSAQTPCSATVTGADGLNQSLTVSYGDNVNAGTATANASFSGDANHTASNGSKTFTIEKATSTTTVTCPTSVTYDGSAQSPCSATVTGAGGLNQPLTVSYTDNINAGTATASASFPGDANHTGSNGSKTFPIDKASSTTTVTCPASIVYNGLAQTPCTAAATGAGGLNQSLTVNYTDNINAGTATASASFPGDANHTGSNGSKTFPIDKASSTTTVTCPASIVYNGLAQTPCTAAATGAGGLNQSLTVNYTDNINAGTATASASFPGDANHTGSNGSKTFPIDKASSTTTVTCPASIVYNGSAQTPCTAAATGAGGLNQSLTVNYTDNINAGTATASASFPGDANHTGSNGSKTFPIDKASSTTTVTCPASIVYNGSAQTPCTAAATGAGGLNQSLTVNYTDNINAGTATASASFPGDANHTGSNGSKTFTIEKATSTTTVTCPASIVYNGLAQTPCTAAATGAGGLNQSLTVNYTDNINAGTATASASFLGDANHTGSSHSSNFTVTKAPATITLSGYGSFIYDGTPRAATATTAPVPLSVVTVTYNGSATAPTNVGTYAVVASLNNPNYEAPNATGTIAITPWRLSGFYQPVDMGGILNTVKGGSTVPLKFAVFQGTTELTDVAVVKSMLTYLVTCDTTAGQEEIETVATGGTVLRYDATAGQFIYNWQTPKSPGKCYITVVTTQDGSSLQAKFKLK